MFWFHLIKRVARVRLARIGKWFTEASQSRGTRAYPAFGSEGHAVRECADVVVLLAFFVPRATGRALGVSVSAVEYKILLCCCGMCAKVLLVIGMRGDLHFVPDA